jgi:glycosyltransferase involved in cell wall biosynthesis
VTSDTPAQAELVSRLGLGAVYPAGDARGFADAVRDVLGRRVELHSRIVDDLDLRHRFSWRAQADKVRSIYEELLGSLPDQAWDDAALHIDDLLGRWSA